MTENELVSYKMSPIEEQEWNRFASNLEEDLYRIAEKLNLGLGQMNSIHNSLFSKRAGREEIMGYAKDEGYYFVFMDTRCYRTIFAGYSYEEARDYLAKKYASDIAYAYSRYAGNPYNGCDYRVFWFENLLKIASRIQSTEGFKSSVDYYENCLKADGNWKYNRVTERFVKE